MDDSNTDDVSARATAARERIMAEVTAGRFQMSRDVGYLFKEAGGRCVGCALGALAFTLCGAQRCPGGKYGVEQLRDQASDTGLVSPEDVRQLEMGYEGWTSIRTPKGNGSRADATHPFHKLGLELRGHAQDLDWEEEDD